MLAVARPSPVSIRALGREDAAAYRSLRLRALAEHPDAFTSSAEEESAKSVEAMAERLAPGSAGPQVVVLGAFADGALVGLVGLERDRRMKVRHRGHVFGMYVPVERSGQGVGRALLGALVELATAQGLSQLVLTVTATNDHARHLYERAGFSPYGREPEAVIVGGVRHDKLHMIRFLPAR